MTPEEIDLEGPYVAAIIRRAIAEEREACAQIAEQSRWVFGKEIAADIRRWRAEPSERARTGK